LTLPPACLGDVLLQLYTNHTASIR
jgi:hypothetical protein